MPANGRWDLIQRLKGLNIPHEAFFIHKITALYTFFFLLLDSKWEDKRVWSEWYKHSCSMLLGSDLQEHKVHYVLIKSLFYVCARVCVFVCVCVFFTSKSSFTIFNILPTLNIFEKCAFWRSMIPVFWDVTLLCWTSGSWYSLLDVENHFPNNVSHPRKLESSLFCVFLHSLLFFYNTLGYFNF